MNRFLASAAACMAAAALLLASAAFYTAPSRQKAAAEWDVPLIRAPETPHIRRPH